MAELKRKFGAAAGTLLRRHRSAPLLSVIVPIYNVEAYLDECLLSIRRQRYRHIEIVIVDDGSPDGSHDIAVRHQRKDRRIRIVRRANGGLSAARNTGVEAATGAFLTFVDSDDTVTADGLAAAMASLTVTGSDLAVLAYERLRGGKPAKAAPWIRRLHATERIGVTLDELPAVMVNATAWAKVFRRDFWDDVGLAFVEGIIYEDQAFTAQAYSAARSFDVLTTTGYSWRLNESSMSQGHVTVENLSARLDAAEASLEILETFPRARAERALQLLRFNVPNSLLKLERADDDYLDLLIRRVPRIVDAVPPDRFAAEVPAQFRVLYELLRQGDCDRVWSYVKAEGMQAEMHPSGEEAAGYSVHLPGWGRDPVPAAAYVLTSDQTQIRAKIVRGRRLGVREFALDVQAWFPNVDVESSLTAVVKAGGEMLDVRVAPHGVEAIVGSRQGAERRYAGSGWTITVRQKSRSLPKTLTIELSLTAGPFAGSKTFANFPSARIEAM